MPQNSPAMLQVRYAHTRDEKEAHFRNKSPQVTSLAVATGADDAATGLPYNQQLLQQLTQAQAGNALLQALLQQQVASAQSQQQNGHLLRLMNLQPSHVATQLPPTQPQPQPLSLHQRHPSHPSSAYAAAHSLHMQQSSAAAAAAAASTVAHSSPYYQPPPSSHQQPQQPDGRATLQKDVRGPEGANVFVYNVPDYFTEMQLQHLFGAYGPLVSVKIQRDRQSGAGKGYGFASFAEPRSAQAAIANLDGLIIDGKKLTVRIKTAAHEHNMHSQPRHPHPHPQHPPTVAAHPHQQYAQQLHYPPQALHRARSQHSVHNSMPSHHVHLDRSSPISATYSPPFHSSPVHHSHTAAGNARLGDLSASLSGLNLGSSSLQSNVSGVGGSGGGFFSSSVAAQPAHAAPSFDAVMQQALYLSQLQQQQQGQSLPLHPLPAAPLVSSPTAQGRGLYSAPHPQPARQSQLPLQQAQPQHLYDSQERQLQMLVAANPQLQLHMAPQYTSRTQQPGSSY